jgi:hypothetical protein
LVSVQEEAAGTSQDVPAIWGKSYRDEESFPRCRNFPQSGILPCKFHPEDWVTWMLTKPVPETTNSLVATDRSRYGARLRLIDVSQHLAS